MKMKILFPFMLLLALSCTAQMPPKNTLCFGVNAAFWGDGDLLGTSFYGEYENRLNAFLAVVPRLSCGNAHKQTKWVSSQLASQSVSLSLRFTPFKREVFERLKLDIGVLFQHTLSSIITYGNMAYSPDGLHVIAADGTKNNLWGLLAGINVNVLQIKNHVLGIRAEMLTSFSGGRFYCDGLQGGLFYGIKF